MDNCRIYGERIRNDDIIDNIKTSGIPRFDPRYIVPTIYPPDPNDTFNGIFVCKGEGWDDKKSGPGVYRYEDGKWIFKSGYDPLDPIYAPNKDGEVYCQFTNTGPIPHLRVLKRKQISLLNEAIFRFGYNEGKPLYTRHILITNCEIRRWRSAISTVRKSNSVLSTTFEFSNCKILDCQSFIYKGLVRYSNCIFNLGAALHVSNSDSRLYIQGTLIDDIENERNYMRVVDKNGNNLSDYIDEFLPAVTGRNSSGGKSFITLESGNFSFIDFYIQHQGYSASSVDSLVFNKSNRSKIRIQTIFGKLSWFKILNYGGGNVFDLGHDLSITFKNGAKDNTLRGTSNVEYTSSNIFPIYFEGPYAQPKSNIDEFINIAQKNKKTAHYFIDGRRYPVEYFAQNVGIKTNNPREALDINGNCRINGFLNLTNTSQDDAILKDNESILFVENGKLKFKNVDGDIVVIT